MYDLIIKNARVIDGTGAPWFRADLAVQGGRIAAVGRLGGATAAETVDGRDLYLAPGFIDPHTHSDDTILDGPEAESRILQGVTTEIGGNCGGSAAPGERFATLEAFLAAVEKKGSATNFGMLSGHGNLRVAAMGHSAQPASGSQIDTMKNLLAQAMAAGAFGMSSGLIYPPGSYANLDELARVAAAMAPMGGYYATHMRSEGDGLIPSVEEAIETARRAGVPLQISHHKAVNKVNWGACKTTVAMILEARRAGLDVTCDQYPYTASATTLASNVPDWAFEGGHDALMARLRDPETRATLRDEANASHLGRWDAIHVAFVQTAGNRWMVGKPVTDIAQAQGKDVADAVFDIILEEDGQVGEINFGMCEPDIEYILAQPFTMVGSDGSALPLSQDGKPHPRNYGAFPRVLAHYSRDRGVIPLETAVFKMTGLPAARLGLPDRGLLRPGMWADLVLFDLQALRDNPTFEHPQQACDGIEGVWVNGVQAARGGRHTGRLAGRVLRKA